MTLREKEAELGARTAVPQGSAAPSNRKGGAGVSERAIRSRWVWMHRASLNRSPLLPGDPGGTEKRKRRLALHHHLPENERSTLSINLNC